MMNRDTGSRVNIRIEELAHSHLVSLVESVTFGSEGLRYRRLDVASQLARLNQPVFVHALIDQQLVGVYVIDERDLLVSGKPLVGFYRGVLAVDPAFQNNGIGHALTEAGLQWIQQHSDASQSLSYGCIDNSNSRSRQLLEKQGAKTAAGLSMYMMYKQWPKVASDVQRFDNPLSQAEVENQQGSDCCIRDVTASKLPLFLIEDEHGVVISARAAKLSFSIQNMGTLASWCTTLFVKPFPIARKRFNPDKFNYVSLSSVYIRPGAQHTWSKFLSAVLAQFKCHFATVYVDPKSELFDQLQSRGLLNRLVHSSTADIAVLVCTDNLELQEIVKRRPKVSLWPVDA